MATTATLDARPSVPTIPYEAVVLPNGRPLPPLPDFELPPLPPITDKDLKDTASTHTSVYSFRRDGRELNMRNKILDYEKLEHVGDGLLGACVVVLLHELYPNLRQGPASRLKDDLVSNDMLAQIADRYGISDRLKASTSTYYVTKMQVKTRGSLFESYIAGVFYSFLQNGPPSTIDEDERNLIGPTPEGSSSPQRQSQEASPTAKQGKPHSSDSKRRGTKDAKDDRQTSKTKDELSSSSDDDRSDGQRDGQDSSERSAILQYPTMVPDQPKAPTSSQGTTEALAPKLKKEDPSRPSSKSTLTEIAKDKSAAKPRTNGEAFDYIYAWLAPLFTPIARYSLQYRMDEQNRLNTTAALEKQDNEDFLSGGAKCALDQYMKNTWGVDPVYSAVRPLGVKGAWISTCVITLPDGTVWKGEATRRTKKLGSSVAAYHVAKQLQIFSGPSQEPEDQERVSREGRGEA